MNIYDLPDFGLESEQFDQLLALDGVRIERIVSCGQVTPEGEWYDQDWDEWVLLIAGSAIIRLADTDDLIALGPGDSLFLPAHSQHRVEQTQTDPPTIWLAVHFNQQEKSK